jgi:hypothetical protein
MCVSFVSDTAFRMQFRWWDRFIHWAGENDCLFLGLAARKIQKYFSKPIDQFEWASVENVNRVISPPRRIPAFSKTVVKYANVWKLKCC